MNQHFKFLKTKIEELYIIERSLIEDDRGFFSRFFCEKEYRSIGFNQSIKQMNHSFTEKKGSIRGMHFQRSPFKETKIIRCTKGMVFDVAVDIRKESPTYLQWHGEILTAEKGNSFYIPEGFAHGFQTLTDNCELLYIHSEFYEKAAEGALNALDSKIDIAWPLEVTEMSDRDRKTPLIDK